MGTTASTLRLYDLRCPPKDNNTNPGRSTRHIAAATTDHHHHHNTTANMDHGSMGGGDAECKIEMLWNWNTIGACFLSSSWRITNGGMMAATCIGVLLFSVLLEFCRRLGKEYDSYLT